MDCTYIFFIVSNKSNLPKVSKLCSFIIFYRSDVLLKNIAVSFFFFFFHQEDIFGKKKLKVTIKRQKIEFDEIQNSNFSQNENL